MGTKKPKDESDTTANTDKPGQVRKTPTIEITGKATKYTRKELAIMDPDKLNKIKLVNEIVEKQELQRTWWKRAFPYIMPLTGLLLTLYLSIKGIYDKDHDKEVQTFKEAEARLKDEVDLIKIVWSDVKSNDTSSVTAKKSFDLLTNIYAANTFRHEEDDSILSIDSTQRPITIFMNLFPNLQRRKSSLDLNTNLQQKIDSLNKAFQKANKAINPNQKSQINQTADEIAPNAFKIFIQYANKEDKATVDNLSTQLKSYYLVPPSEYVKNTVKYTNEVRYSNIEYKNKAEDLAERLKTITQKTFITKHIREKTAKNTLEVWYDNRPESNQEAKK